MAPRLVVALSATLLLPLSTPAQQFTTPPGFEVHTGAAVAYNHALSIVGSRNSARLQSIVGDMTQDVTLTGLSWRTSAAVTYSSSNGSGRSFAQLTFSLGYTANGYVMADFSKNWSGTPTTVFQGTWSLPSVTASNPAPVWGNGGSFVFTKPMTYQGGKGYLLQEWSHTGGQLSNGSTTAIHSRFELEAPLYELYAAGPSKELGYTPWSQSAPCKSATPSTDFYIGVAAIDHPEPAVRGFAYIGATTLAERNRTLIGMLSLTGWDAGVDIGARCNKLYVDPRLAIYTTAMGTDSLGVVRWFPSSTVPWNRSWQGQTFYFQAGWEDSGTKRLSLSNAVRVTAPATPVAPRSNLPTHCLAYSIQSGTSPYSIGPLQSNDPALDPTDLWSRK